MVVDAVHEAAHVENSATIALETILGSQGIVHQGRVEARPFVGNADHDLVAVDTHLHRHLLRGILPIAVFDGIGHRLAHSDLGPVARVVVRTQPLQAVVEDNLDQFDVLEPAADGQVDLGIRGVHGDRGTLAKRQPASDCDQNRRERGRRRGAGAVQEPQGSRYHHQELHGVEQRMRGNGWPQVLAPAHEEAEQH